MSSSLPIVLGSRSPRRRELLGLLVPPQRIIVRPPLSSDEAGFDDLTTLPQFERRIGEIVQAKAADVIRQLLNDPQIAAQSGEQPSEVFVVASDTTVVVTKADGTLLSLGQPPTDPSWPDTVRDWFRSYLGGKTHLVLSGVSVTRVRFSDQSQQAWSHRCVTRVTMRPDVEPWLDWYIATGEPQGKAGGYAVQGAGSVFVTQIEGSYSNVVGLPLEETLALLREAGACP